MKILGRFLAAAAVAFAGFAAGAEDQECASGRKVDVREIYHGGDARLLLDVAKAITLEEKESIVGGSMNVRILFGIKGAVDSVSVFPKNPNNPFMTESALRSVAKAYKSLDGWTAPDTLMGQWIDLGPLHIDPQR